MNQYAATIETDDDELNRETVEYDALSASEAQAYAMDDLQENQRIIAIWQRIF
jgi:N6-adenosine-specific RNA methylase IME4